MDEVVKQIGKEFDIDKSSDGLRWIIKTHQEDGSKLWYPNEDLITALEWARDYENRSTKKSTQ